MPYRCSHVEYAADMPCIHLWVLQWECACCYCAGIQRKISKQKISCLKKNSLLCFSASSWEMIFSGNKCNSRLDNGTRKGKGGRFLTVLISVPTLTREEFHSPFRCLAHGSMKEEEEERMRSEGLLLVRTFTTKFNICFRREIIRGD